MKKLISITPLTGDSGRCRLAFDDGTVLKTAVSVAADQQLYPGKTLDEAAWQALREAVEAAGARLRAVRIVSAAAVSEKELCRRLERKGERPEHAAAATAWLRELGAVDDARLAQSLVRRAAAKGYGPARIRQELAAKGVPRAHWDAALASLPAADGAIDRYLAQKTGGVPPDRAQQKKLIDALRRRGHSWADIQAGLRRLSEQELEFENWDGTSEDD